MPKPKKDTIKRMVNGRIVEVQRSGYNSIYPEILQAIDDLQEKEKEKTMTEQELIECIFGKIDETANNGSDGIDDDEFTRWASVEKAELYA